MKLLYGKNFTALDFMHQINMKNTKQYTSNSYSNIHTTI